MQVAVHLAYLAATGAERGPHLVVAPASVLSNWERELGRWAPELRVKAYRGGANRERTQHALVYGDAEGANASSSSSSSLS